MEYFILIVALAGLVAAWWLRHTGYGGRKATKAVMHRSFAQAELEELAPEIRESALAVLRGQGIEAAVDHLREEAHLPKAQAEHVLILLARSELRRGQMFDDAQYPDPSAAPAAPAPTAPNPPPASNWSDAPPVAPSPPPASNWSDAPPVAPSPPPASNWSDAPPVAPNPPPASNWSDAPAPTAPSPPPASNWSDAPPVAPSPPPASNWSDAPPVALDPPSSQQDPPESRDNAS